ncbi:transmembrane protein 70 homolog, mitochondrial-like [Amphibalanus amphitrite]|uniref:transmembrane protein 70 homolog, mitochondrial-like n=1 Tax=Amphibalanus amphitrite TaxID=1232801 RepID=UPI001C92421E|nr:transmembrane protein 70 homolog, mitochondrial-like [Amphibalanus amphitrite]XP_043227871.1 transmembrane protein 70 homolog, mitochondrial-like [Amphibalanus amphitrite]XP_043227878.1 transmembrane protein 70 homolog, mitochondrial-like [Amphibalanus amphitrite]XP_043227889.1 transmembrane protein 70 homolog, mitochondrial-like [Amphibalanus amphitrite]XP_043227900.1 transmembrane protein 70 homolog, mitochondrial-like [Amphibalanus amphitrite]XP_043227911.1 transmembrane protein 70 homol
MFRLVQCSRVVGRKLSTCAVPVGQNVPIVHTPQLAHVHKACIRRLLHSSCSASAERVADKPEPLVVYRGPLTGQMKRLKVFSLFTSAVGMYVAPTVMAEMGKAGMGIAIMMGSVMGIFTLMTPVLIHLVVRNYVTQLTYDPSSDRYTANTITLMLRTRQVEFSPADVHVPDVPGMFTTFVAKGKPLFADANHFQPIEHFGRIMGYDRPVDLKLGKRPSSDQEQPPA